MKKIFLYLLSATMLFTACSGKEDNITPEQKPEPENPITVEPVPQSVDISDETVQLNSIQLEEILDVDEKNTTITFSSSLPTEQIPQKGQIILQFSPTKELPYGFLGRVTNISNNGDKIIVETEAPALNEAFDKLIFDDELQIIDNTSRSSFINIGKDDEGYNYTMIDITGEVKLNKSVTVGIGGSITFSSKIQQSSMMDNSTGADDMNLDFKTKFNAGDLRVNVKVEANNEDSNFLKRPIGPAIPLSGVLGKLSVSLELQPYLGTQAEGEAGIQCGFTYEGRKEYKVKHSNGVWHDIESVPGEDPRSALETPWDGNVSIYMNGSVKLGLFVAVEMKLFGNDRYKISLAPYFGYKLSGEQVLIDFTDINYEESKDTHLTGGVVAGLDVTANANFFQYEVDAGIFSTEWMGFETKRWLFPEFAESTLTIADNNANCSTNVGRDLLFKSDVGIGQYNKDNEMTDYSTPLPYFLEQEFANPIAKSFTHHEDYTYWTYVKWGDKTIKCKQFEDDSIIGMWVCIKEKGWKVVEHYLYSYTYYWDWSWDFQEPYNAWGLIILDNGKLADFDFYYKNGIWEFDDLIPEEIDVWNWELNGSDVITDEGDWDFKIIKLSNGILQGIEQNGDYYHNEFTLQRLSDINIPDYVYDAMK